MRIYRVPKLACNAPSQLRLYGFSCTTLRASASDEGQNLNRLIGGISLGVVLWHS